MIMKKKTLCTSIKTLAITLPLIAAVSGCGSTNAPAEKPAAATETVAEAAPVVTPEPVSTEETEAATEKEFPTRKDGERFEATIVMEGMEETVQYEHIVDEAIGIEMDYDYEQFVRQKRSDREVFVSEYDDPENPENYLEVSYSPEDADTVIAMVSEMLSQTYDITQESYDLDYAGPCTRIGASEDKGTNQTAEQMQMVYVIPAEDGSRIGIAHYSFEGAEGFGRRFAYMMNTLIVIPRSEGETATDGAITDEQALSAIKDYCYASIPDLKSIEEEYPVYWEIESSDGDQIVVLFRSYTGALVRYYIDPASGETYVTEFVSGITPEEERTEETLNVKDYIK